MNSGTLATVLLGLLLMIASCGKKTSGGSWTFKGTSYSGSTVRQDNTLSSEAGDGVSILSVTFPGTALPANAGVYTVTDSLVPAAGFAFIGMSIGSTTYSSTGGNGLQTVTVSVNKGKVSIIGSGITMYSTGPDSAALSLNIVQQ